MFVTELKEAMIRSKYINLLITIVIMLFYIALSFLILTYTTIQSKDSSISTFENHNIYGIYDTLYDDEEQEFLNNTNSLNTLKSLYTTLNYDLNDNYIVAIDQPIELNPEIDLNEKFLYGYEFGSTNNILESGYYLTKAIKLNQKAIDLFPLSIEEGNNFEDSHFYDGHSPEILPVIVGAEYKDTFRLGDIVEANYLNKNYNIKVTGILKENSMIPTRYGQELYLDRFIILPAIHYSDPIDQNEYSFQMRHYLQLINGNIYSEKDINYVENKLNEVKEINNFPYLQVIGSVSIPFSNVFSAIEEQISMLTTLTVILFISCVLIISLLTIKKVQNNNKNMVIHLICGSNINQLLKYIIYELITLLSIPGFLSILIFLIIFGFVPLLPIYILVIIFCSIILLFISLIPILIQFKNFSFNKLLKYED